MAVLVTGSSGYIGSELVVALKSRGIAVVGIDRRPPVAGAKPDTFVLADLLDEGPLESVLLNVSEVFHLAAAKDDWGLSERDYYRDNLDATARLLSLGRARGVKRWVFYSTVGVLGSGLLARGEGAPYNPETPYASSKVDAEKLFNQYAREDPTAAIAVIRPSAVFSPANPTNNNLYRLIQAIKQGRFVMVGDGEDLKATSYLYNLLAATSFVHERLSPGFEIYHYVDEPVWTTRQLVDAIYGLLGKRQTRWHLPGSLAKATATVLDLAATLLRTDIPVTGARIRKFCTSTNFSCEKLGSLGFVAPVSIQQAVSATVLGHDKSGIDARRAYREAVPGGGVDLGQKASRTDRAA
jgi:nucleoside-diphosphate-sugar epimerase